MEKKEKGWVFLRIEDEDEKLIALINNDQLKHLNFGYGSYAWVHAWSFDSLEEAKEEKAIIKEFCPNARDKF